MLGKAADGAVLALAATLLEERWPGRDHAAAGQFVIGQVGRMQGLLRVAIGILAVAFACTALLRCGGRLSRLEQPARLKVVALWRRAPIGPMREFVRMVETLALFAVYGGRDG